MEIQLDWKFIKDLQEQIRIEGVKSYNARTKQDMLCLYGINYKIHPKLFYGKFNKKHYKLNYERIWYEEDNVLEKFNDECSRQAVVPIFYPGDISPDQFYHDPDFVPPCIMHIRLENCQGRLLAFSTIRSSNIEMLKDDILFIGDIVKRFCRKLNILADWLFLNIENCHIYVSKKSGSIQQAIK